VVKRLFVVLMFAVSCSAPQVAARPAAPPLFPPLPDSVLSYRGWTRVHRVDPPMYCGQDENGPIPAWGCYTYESRKIEVVRGLTPYEERMTLEHEKVHMTLGDAHLDAYSRHTNPIADDSIADAIASLRMLEFLAERRK
jgi:hypothetical protein